MVIPFPLHRCHCPSNTTILQIVLPITILCDPNKRPFDCEVHMALKEPKKESDPRGDWTSAEATIQFRRAQIRWD